ncbi:hypothetical protein HYV86_02640 [Candidatus Woesearchaeota archaeon]|nr:hypothetical protein [Candidatus Woesearchaeota archaeon]
MSSTNIFRRSALITILVGGAGVNYTHGYRPASENLEAGMNRRESEDALYSNWQQHYCDKATQRCDPRILINPLTMVGRAVAYATYDQSK